MFRFIGVCLGTLVRLLRASEPLTRESGATSTTRRTEASASTAKIIDLLDKLFGVPARLCRLPTGLLTLEISFQYKRNPALCQRTTVSGVTTMRDCCHADQNRRTATQKSLSSRSNLGRGCRRFSTASC